jgi:hypothetical protein
VADQLDVVGHRARADGSLAAEPRHPLITYLHSTESDHGSTSKPIELKAGDVFVIEPGFKATWEVVERVRKYYVFVLA